MRKRGFTLVELCIVIAIMAVLLSIAGLAFNKMTKNGAVDNQTKVLLADLMTVRSQALYEKKPGGRSVVVTATLFSVYSSNQVTGNPVLVKVLKVPVNPATLRVDFDQWGAATLNGDSTLADASICAQATNGAGVDSVVIGKTRMQIGKLHGVGCTSGNIDVR